MVEGFSGFFTVHIGFLKKKAIACVYACIVSWGLFSVYFKERAVIEGGMVL